MKYGTQTKDVATLKEIEICHPAQITETDEIVASDMSFDYQYRETVPTVAWTPSEIQEIILTFIGKGVFTVEDVRGKLLAIDGKKYRLESKLLDDKTVLKTLKMATVFGLSGFSAMLNKKGHVTFKFCDMPVKFPFGMTFRSPEEAEKDRLLALGKRVSKGMETANTRKIILNVVEKATVGKTEQIDIPAEKPEAKSEVKTEVKTAKIA